MIGLCQAYTGSDPWVAPAEKAYVRVQRMSLGGQGDTEMYISSDNTSDVQYPATVIIFCKNTKCIINKIEDFYIKRLLKKAHLFKIFLCKTMLFDNFVLCLRSK